MVNKMGCRMESQKVCNLDSLSVHSLGMSMGAAKESQKELRKD